MITLRNKRRSVRLEGGKEEGVVRDAAGQKEWEIWG